MNPTATDALVEGPVAETAAPPVEASPPSTDAIAGADWEDDDEDDWGDDDWEDDTGPLDRTPKISGALMASARATTFASESLPDGTELLDHTTFQLEHTHLKFAGDLSHKLSWEIMPCITHMNSFSVITANFAYAFHSAFQVTAGRFLLPFGQFNLRSLPGSYIPVSRPLLYTSHEDRAVRFDYGTPESLMFTPRDDLGVQIGGNLWFGPDDAVQFSYLLYATNGLREASPQMSRHWDDNNRGKQLGGRTEFGYYHGPLSATVGGSLITNDYEDDPVTHRGLDQLVWDADASFSLQSVKGQRLTLRAEYVRMHREIVPDEELRRGDESLEGLYATAVVEFELGTGLYYQFDALRQTTPHAAINETFHDVELLANRHVAGVFLTAAEFVQIKAEYGLWRHGWGIPDAHRIALQTIVSF